MIDRPWNVPFRHVLWFLFSIAIILAGVLPFYNFVGHSHWEAIEWVPFQRFIQSPEQRIDLSVDAVANVLLFIPFGYLFPFVRKTGRKPAILRVLGAAVFLSISIELYQVFNHYRSPSMADVLTNSVGAIVGATIGRQKKSRISGSRIAVDG